MIFVVGVLVVPQRKPYSEITGPSYAVICPLIVPPCALMADALPVTTVGGLLAIKNFFEMIPVFDMVTQTSPFPSNRSESDPMETRSLDQSAATQMVSASPPVVVELFMLNQPLPSEFIAREPEPPHPNSPFPKM